MGNKILFVGHDSRRSGAPILLLEIIKWFKKNTSYEIIILLKKGGALIEEYQKLGKTIIFYENFPSLHWRIRKIRNLNHQKKVIKYIQSVNWTFIFSNTITNGDILQHIKLKSFKIFTYVHELDNAFNLYDVNNQVKGTLDKTDFYFCGSNSVSDVVLRKIDINKSNYLVINSSIPSIENKIKNKNTRTELLETLGFSNTDFIVGMMGALEWRKGPDLFFNVALKFKDVDSFKFIWVGVRDDDKELFEQLEFDTNLSGMKSKMKFIKANKDYEKYYSLFDVFLLSSREDPFPMVMVESAAYGLPVIGFKGTGGIDEFTANGTGFKVEPFDYSKIKTILLRLNSDEKFYIEQSNQSRVIALDKYNLEKNILLMHKTILKVIQE